VSKPKTVEGQRKKSPSARCFAVGGLSFTFVSLSKKRTSWEKSLWGRN